MIETVDTSQAEWVIASGDDPPFVRYAERLVAAAAVVGGQRDITAVHIDNWFGVRWLGFFKCGILGFRASAHDLCVPPFHPNRVLADRRYELCENGVLQGPFPSARPLHRHYVSLSRGARRFKTERSLGVYAWYSGNTKANDRASLMVYTHAADGTSGWYVEFRKRDGWRLSHRTGIGDAEWHRLLAISGIRDLQVC